MGIFTKSTKTRLEELENSKEDLEVKIANEKLAKPRISPEFVTFWLHKFRKLDINRLDHRKWLINVFVNTIYLYDDKMVITFNYKNDTRNITLDDVKWATKKIIPARIWIALVHHTKAVDVCRRLLQSCLPLVDDGQAKPGRLRIWENVTATVLPAVAAPECWS
jgi:hypothetical protein